MSVPRQWPQPRKIRGHSLKTVTMKFDPLFVAALKQYANEEAVAMSTILMSLSLDKDARLRQLFLSEQKKQLTPATSSESTPRWILKRQHRGGN